MMQQQQPAQQFSAPARWPEVNQESLLWGPLRSLRTREQGAPRRSILMLDYDGTLAPFRNDPLQAYPYPGVEERLRRLVELPAVRLVIISGRTVAGIERLLGDTAGVEIWGNHGWERRLPEGGYHADRLTSAELETIEQVRRRMKSLGYGGGIEQKPASIAVHWRALGAGDREKIRTALEDLVQNLAPGRLQVVPFDGGLELRSPEHNKGSAVRAILAEEAGNAPSAFLGDDLTDEDAFRALGTDGIGILVRPEPRDTGARYWIRPPQELLGFLDRWIESAEG